MIEQNQHKTVCMSHRGVKTKYPENTMGAYRDAVSAGYRSIEFDVVMSKDKTLYCSHNHDLERETDGFGYIHDLRDSDIEEGLAIHPITGMKEKIPRLDVVLGMLPKDMFLNIEIKSRKFFEIDIALQTAQLVKRHVHEHRIIVSSFNPIVLRAVRILARNIKTGYLIKSRKHLLLYGLSGSNNIHPRADILNDGLIQYCNRRKIEIIPWTVNTSPAKDHILAQGIGGIISDEKRLLSSAT